GRGAERPRHQPGLRRDEGPGPQQGRALRAHRHDRPAALLPDHHAGHEGVPAPDWGRMAAAADLLTAARAGDEAAFAGLVEPPGRELRVHCYRMLGSVEDAEDLVQETFLRAWRHLAGFEGRSSLRAWLYRIATNACLDAVDGRARRVLPPDLGPPSDPSAALPPRTDVPWLQPFPDRLLEPATPAEDEPGAAVAAREAGELAVRAALQHLPPAQRAVLILRDVAGWPAKEAAAQLDLSVAAANSALHRARPTLRAPLPGRRADG